MPKTATTHVRLTPEIKEQAENILKELGISILAAHELFYRQIIAHQGIPFELRVIKKRNHPGHARCQERQGEKIQGPKIL